MHQERGSCLPGAQPLSCYVALKGNPRNISVSISSSRTTDPKPSQGPLPGQKAGEEGHERGNSQNELTCSCHPWVGAPGECAGEREREREREREAVSQK